jgi:hypothetical protein
MQHSPTPWNAGDKHAFLYDDHKNCIAAFNSDPEKWPHGSKAAIDLANRNRIATCVNALHDIRDPHAFVAIAKLVASRSLPPEAIGEVIEGDKVFAVRGRVAGSENATLDPQTLREARYRAYLANDAGAEVRVVYLPTDTLIP